MLICSGNGFFRTFNFDIQMTAELIISIVFVILYSGACVASLLAKDDTEIIITSDSIIEKYIK